MARGGANRRDVSRDNLAGLSGQLGSKVRGTGQGYDRQRRPVHVGTLEENAERAGNKRMDNDLIPPPG